jgi:hypothetical protein
LENKLGIVKNKREMSSITEEKSYQIDIDENSEGSESGSASGSAWKCRVESGPGSESK